MNHLTRNAARSLVATAAALLVLALLPQEMGAEDLTSVSYRLRGGTLSGGGEVALRSTAPVPSIGSGGVTIGQPGPIGIGTGPTSGITLHAGFWPIVAGGAGVLDSDGDGIADSSDNCIDVQNGGQLDTDGDDYGNACDCDFDQSLTCSIDDFNVYLPDFASATDSGVGTDMDGSGAVGIADFNLFLPGFAAGEPGPSGLVP
jgi:hypothetical protein